VIVNVLSPPDLRQDDLELLIREARARQRRRWAVGAAAVAICAGAALGIYALIPGATRSSHPKKETSPRPNVSRPRCGVGQLRLSGHGTGVTGVATGNLLGVFTLTNASRTACRLGGWPKVQRLNRAGRELPTHYVRGVFKPSGNAPFHEVSLRPGGATSFNVFGDNAPCATTRTVRVEPPGDRAWLSVATRMPACSALYVLPLVAGRTDPQWMSVTLKLFHKTTLAG
jgi:hypothetical protein